MRGLVPALLFAFGLAAACASTLPAEKAEPPITPSVSWDAGINQATDTGPQQSAALDARLTEWERFHDWRSTVFATGMPSGEPVVHAVSAAPPKRVKPRTPAQIRLYAFSGETCAKKSAFGMPFEADGSLCSGVIGRSALLDDSERAAVVAMVTEADASLDKGESRPYSRCDFNPHHAFVFFDDKGAPIGRVEPCFECGQVLWEPSMHPQEVNHDQPPQMTPQERHLLQEIADKHSLGGWAFDPESEEVRRVLAYRDALYGTPEHPTELGSARVGTRLALPPPVDRNLTAMQGTVHDRQRICAWWDEQIQVRSHGGPRMHYECEGGVPPGFQLEQGDCEKKLQACDATVDAFQDCLRAFAQPDVMCKGFPDVCRGVERCVPGLRFTKPK